MWDLSIIKFAQAAELVLGERRQIYIKSILGVKRTRAKAANTFSSTQAYHEDGYVCRCNTAYLCGLAYGGGAYFI